MTASLLAVALAVQALGGERPTKESWTSISMEGAAIMGELMYQHRDLDGAKEKFRDSIGTSLKLNDPSSHWVALDLYRTAEIEAREGRFNDARRHLDILLNRYPDSEWARRARRLLDILGDPKREEEEEDDFIAPAPSADGPEEALGRLQAAYREDRIDYALREAHAFRYRFPASPAAAEVAVLEGSLWLKLGDPGHAADALSAALGASGETADKARYLLAGAQLALGDSRTVLETMPAVDPAKSPNKWLALGQVWRAAALARQGRAGQAAELYGKVARSSWRSPAVAQARAALAEGLAKSGKRTEALAELVAAGREAEKHGMRSLAGACRLNIAHFLYRDRRLQEAAAAYREFARAHPEDPERAEALYQRGLALRRSGKRGEALKTFEELVEAHSGSPASMQAHLQLGQLYTDFGRSEKAIEHYRALGQPGTASGSGDGSPESMLLEAQVHYNGGRYREAIPLYERFLRSTPEDQRAQEVQDLLLLAYWSGARDDPGMLKAVDLYPDRPLAAQIRFELGGRAYKAKDCEAAEEQFQRVASDFPNAAFVADALYYQGECRLRRQDFLGAADAFRRVAEEHPKSRLAAKARFRRAAAHFEAGDLEESARLYGSLSRDKGALAADSAFNRALALSKGERKDAALGAFEDLLERFPKHARASWAWLQAGRLRQELGRFAAAADAFAKVRGADRPQALLSAGRCRERLGQRTLALKAYEELRRARPADDPSRLHGMIRLGLLYELQSKLSQARPLYREVLRLSSNPSLNEVARQRLEGGEAVTRGIEADPALP